MSINLNSINIFGPALALMAWTAFILLLVPYRRFKAFFTGKVNADNFKYGETNETPSWVVLPNRIFMNLLEVPVMFYVLTIIIYVTHHVDSVFITLGWVYFTLRILHSIIYISYNHVIHRFFVFAISNFIVVAIWIRLVMIILGA